MRILSAAIQLLPAPGEVRREGADGAQVAWEAATLAASRLTSTTEHQLLVAGDTVQLWPRCVTAGLGAGRTGVVPDGLRWSGWHDSTVDARFIEALNTPHLARRCP